MQNSSGRLRLPECACWTTGLSAGYRFATDSMTSFRRYGGHIGYCVLPDDRRCGYATQILRQSLAITSAIGLDRVMLTCDDDNIGSITVIESCGGLLTATLAGP